MFNIYTQQRQQQQKQYVLMERSKVLRHRQRLDGTMRSIVSSEKQCQQASAGTSYFIHRTGKFRSQEQMQQQPLEVGDDHDQNWEFVRQFRDIHQHEKNISDERFHLRDETDWQSILSPLERAERRSNQLMNSSYLEKTGLSKSLLNRNSTSQQPFVDIKKECYRERKVESQIQQPMAFTMTTPRTRPLLYSKDTKAPKNRYHVVHEYQSADCKRTHEHQQNIAKNLEDCITDRKSAILQRTMKHNPRVKSTKLSSTGSSFRRTVTTLNSNFSEQKVHASKSMVDPILAEQFSLGKQHRKKLYFKDVESIANIPSHQLANQAKQVMYGCNLYRYRKCD